MSPSVGPAINLDRVQGLRSDVTDLALRNGKGLVALIGEAITSASLTRSIDASSSITVSVYDPELKLLGISLLSKSFDGQIDGLHFRYLGASKSGKNITLTFEDREVARLRELTGPKKAYRKKTTRAEFIIGLVRELKPAIPFFCPQLHVIQPIENRRQGKNAADESKANRGAGIGDTKGLTVKGANATPEQIDVIDRSLRAAASHTDERDVLMALVMALAVESVAGKFARNLLGMTPETEADSKYSATVPEESAAGFVLGYVPGHEGAIEWARNHSDAKPYEIAQGVQKSGAGLASDGAANYGVWETEAGEWLDAFDGGGLAGSDTVAEPYTFEVKKNETYWAAIQRLAKEVNWRAFVVAGRFFLIDEIELLRGQVRLAIDREKVQLGGSGVEDVDFDFNHNKVSTEITVSAYAKDWKVPPGAVVTLAGYGPASVGSGDAPLAKGQKAALSNNRNARTGEGRGRYLVERIESPLGQSGDARLAQITLKRATRPLPEKAATTKTVSGESTASGVGDETVQRMREFAEGEVGKPYVWGAVGPDSYDCSGFVSRVLIVGDLLEARLTTSGLAGWGEAGEGEFVTVHDKVGTGSSKTEHVLIEIEGVMFECGGISGGVGKPDYSASELAEFSTKRHPKGL